MQLPLDIYICYVRRGERTTYQIARVFECAERFSTGREDVEDDEKSDGQVTIKTDGNVQKMRTHVRTNRYFGIRQVSRQTQSMAVGFCVTTKRR
jgi:hypothetical protein